MQSEKKQCKMLCFFEICLDLMFVAEMSTVCFDGHF